jgi:hypothetical protein
LKCAKGNAAKALFLLAASSLVVGLVVAPAAAATSASSSVGSNTQRLIGASAPHTYIDFKGSWAGQEAQIAANLARYDVVALHYTDAAQHVQAIKAINPNTVVLAYFNPLFGGSEGKPHEEWYLRDASGKTHASGYNEPLMDLTNPGWRATCVQICQNALQKGFDGLVLDNGLTSPNVLWPRSWSGSDSAWQSSTIDLYRSVKQAAGAKPVIYNGAYFIPGYVDALDGWMDEGFPFYKGWDKSIGFAQDASSKGKLTLFYAQGSASQRYFCYCSALLTDGYFFYAPTGTKWFDDYGIQLGTPLNKAGKKPDGTWQRDYQYGTVVVNPITKLAHISQKSGQQAASKPAAAPSKVISSSKVAVSVQPTKTTANVKVPATAPVTSAKAAATTTPTKGAAPAAVKAAPPSDTSKQAQVAASLQTTSYSSSRGSDPVMVVNSASEAQANGAVQETSISAAQTSSVASLPPQPVLEFSMLGLGIPAIVAGCVYLLMRR